VGYTPSIPNLNNPPKVADEVEERITKGNHTSDSDLFRFGKSASQVDWFALFFSFFLLPVFSSFFSASSSSYFSCSSSSLLCFFLSFDC